MREIRLAIAIATLMACRESPTGPTSTDPYLEITFRISNLASLSLSEPTRCPADWVSCTRGPQPQGPASTGAVVSRTYSRAPGTYRLTGVLQSDGSTGSSLSIRIGSTGAQSTRGGAIQRVLEVVGFTGDQAPPVSVISETCGGNFAVEAAGALDWAFVFEVSTGSIVTGACQ
jgi:hypothetical protein